MIITISQAGSEKIQYYIYTYKGKEGGREGGMRMEGRNGYVATERQKKTTHGDK